MVYRWISATTFLGIIFFAFWFCRFAIIESDYFWHVAAGDIMRSARAMIHTDPFSWTREGMPYGSNHEWLAQIVFSIVASFGTHAEYVLRSTLVAVTACMLLLIGRRMLWLGLPLAMLAIIPSLGGFVDRPQLFTYVFLAASLLAATSYLSRPQKSTLILFPIIHILWINTHGAAAVLNGIIVFALFAQTIIDAWRDGWSPDARRKMLFVGLALLSLLPASLISPMGLENITYLLRLNADATVQAIQEWRPRDITIYLKALWPVYVMTIAALAMGRRHILFSLIILLPLIYLSRQAYRHEMLLSFAALGIVMHQLRGWSDGWMAREAKSILNHLTIQPSVLAFTILLILTIPLCLHAERVRLGFVQNTQAYGTVRDRVSGAVAFLEREKILAGRIFNTYNIGGELDLALQPTSGKTFVDGRNIDFGDAFLTPLFGAGGDPAVWKSLEEKYGFTVAIIDIPQNSELYPYIDHLRDNPSWSLVFMDDFAAVYLKDIPSNHPTIQQYTYRFIDPKGFRKTAGATTETVKGIEAELKRVIATSPEGIHATILLARLYAANNILGPAESLLRDLVARHPVDYRPVEELALLLVKAGRFEEAATEFEHMRALLGTMDGPDVRANIAEAFTKAGAEEWAERYR